MSVLFFHVFHRRFYIHFRLQKPFLASSCLSACISAAPTGRIFVKFDVGDFCINLWRHSQIWLNPTVMSDTWRKDLSTSYCCRRGKLAIKAFFWNTAYFVLSVTCGSTVHTERIVAFSITSVVTLMRPQHYVIRTLPVLLFFVPSHFIT